MASTLNLLITTALNLRRTATVFITISVLQACSLFPSSDESTLALTTQQFEWSEIRPDIAHITSWQLTGKVGIRTPEDAITAAINQWTQVDDLFNIDISSTFFGIGASNITGTSDFITLSEAGEEPVHSSYPNELIESALGLALPLTYLPYWIKALPIPNRPFDITLNSQGLPEKITQLGWDIHFSRYQLIDGIPLPKKLKLTSEQSRITLAIKQWTLI